MSGNPEIHNSGAELGAEAQKAAANRSAELAKNSSERGSEQSPESRAEAVETARAEANKEALLGKESGGAESKAGGEPSASGVRKVTKKQKDIEYKKTLVEIRSQMSAPSRAFSKVVHNPVVEKTSEIASKTIARPNAILAGATMAFIVVTVVYLTAKHYGYVLSGFETIGAFIIGWLAGTILDYFRLMITGGKSS